ncbi:MAG: NAD(P)H-dependent flavin oxidoreductase [Cyclobacteriaceae bacterium]
MKRRSAIKAIGLMGISSPLLSMPTTTSNNNTMWNKTKVTELLGIKYPIIQGPFGGGLSSLKLLSTVSNLGGLGSYGVHTFSAEQILALNKEILNLTNKPYALNLWVSDHDERLSAYTKADYEKLKIKFKPYFDELGIAFPEMQTDFQPKFDQQVEAVLKAKPPVFSFVFGIPAKEILNECRKSGIKTIGTATTPDEAMALEEAKVDLVVATGAEAGGHRVSFIRSAEDSLTGTFALIPQVVDKIKTPVIAAGGIADGRGIVAALTLGASAVQIGTAFLACEESNAIDMHRQKLFSPEAKYTTLTRVFTGRLARGIVSRLSEDMKDFQKELAPFPLQSSLMSGLRKAAIEQNKPDTITFWSGQIAPILKYRNATDLFHSLVADTEMILRNLR